MPDKYKIAIGIMIVLSSMIYLEMVGDGKNSNNYERVYAFPKKIFGGGGEILFFDIELNQRGKLHATFAKQQVVKGKDKEMEDRGINVEMELLPGPHLFQTELAKHTYTFVKIEILRPIIGAELSWKVTLDNTELKKEQKVLEEPLKEGDRFVLELEWEGDE